MATQGLKLTKPAQQKFLKLLGEGMSITKAAKRVGVDRQSIYNLRDRDPAFEEAYQVAYKLGTGVLEDIALERAKKSSDYLLAMLLKARKPELYDRRPSGVGRIQLPGGAPGAPAAPGDGTVVEVTFDFGNDIEVKG